MAENIDHGQNAGDEEITFLRRLEFGSISLLEMLEVDKLNRSRGLFKGEDMLPEWATEADELVEDAAGQINHEFAKVKEVVGDDVARGFIDSVHFLKFMNAERVLPKPVPGENDGSALALIAV